MGGFMSLILDGTNGLSDVDGTAAAPAIRGTDANTGIFFPAADTIAFAEGGAEVARFDSSGQLGIGTSSPWSQISSYGASGATTQFIGFKNADGGDIRFGKASGVDNNCLLGTFTGNRIKFYTNSVNVMDLDTSGNLLVGTTTYRGRITSEDTGTNTSSAPMGVNVTSSAGAGSCWVFTSVRLGTNVGGIQNTSTATQYVTSSDYRLKNTIAPMTGALDKVALLKPCTYKWNVDGSDGQGFIAHELDEVVPGCVTGEKDAVETYTDEDGNEATRPAYQGIDTSFLVATLTAAIQEQQALITALTTRITALEAA
jgi:hypothetical protein